MLERLNSLWVGDKLGYLEQLCLASALNAGHTFTLYSYTPEALKGVPSGVELKDAAEVMPRERLVGYADTGSFALGANFFRYELLAKGLGYWVDMDFIFLRPLDFAQEYVFGWEHEGWINNAVLLAPSGSRFVHDLCTLPATNRRPPWFGPRRSALYYFRRLTQGTIRVEDLPWGTYSSGMVTHLVKRHRLQSFAQSPEVFYPVRWGEARMLYEDSEKVTALIRPETRAVHMWHSRLVDLARMPPPAGSYVAEMCKKFDVDCGSA